MPPSEESLTSTEQLGSSQPVAIAPPDLLPPPFPGAEVPAAAPVCTNCANCANCGAPLAGPYCAQCGQHVADFHQSLWRLSGELIDNLFCWDNKFVRTLRPLLVEPGLLTREFMAGRRVRYVQPLRLFLFVSAICLTLLQLDHGEWMHLHINPPKTHKTHAVAAPHPSILTSPAPAGTPPGADPSAAGLPSTDAKRDPQDKGDTDLSRLVDGAMAAKSKARGENAARQEIATNVQHRLSWVALALLPIFALLLRALYWRGNSFYFTHLVFSLHYHTFLLLFWTVFIGWKSLISATFLLRWLTPFNWLLLIIPPIYLFKALQQVYGGGSKTTFTKVIFIGTIHLLALLVSLAAVSLLTIFT